MQTYGYSDVPWEALIVSALPIAAGLCMLISIGVLAVLGFITARIAHDKGRNPFGWFIIGLTLGIAGVGLALVLLPASYYAAEHQGPQHQQPQQVQ